VWHLPGFVADFQVIGPDGAVLSENHYDLTAEEIRDFVTTVYPVPPTRPVDALVLTNSNAREAQGAGVGVVAGPIYSERLLELGVAGRGCSVRYEASIPRSGEYLVRCACDSGEALAGFELLIDGKAAEREQHPFLQLTEGITRQPYSSRKLSWLPGWRATLTEGVHRLIVRRAAQRGASPLALDAICLQPSRR
jgi:hypothetical protein